MTDTTNTTGHASIASQQPNSGEQRAAAAGGGTSQNVQPTIVSFLALIKT